MDNLNDTTRSYPRTLNEAFPNSPEYAQAVEHYPQGSGLFEFILLLIGFAMLAALIGVFL